MNRTSKLAIAALIAATLTTSLASVNAQRVIFDPAINVASVNVNLGETKEHTVFVPIGDVFLAAGEGVDNIKLKGVEGPGGLSATLKSAKVVTKNGQRQLELKLDVKHEFFKGTGAGAFPIKLSLENTKTSGLCNFIVTVNLK